MGDLTKLIMEVAQESKEYKIDQEDKIKTSYKALEELTGNICSELLKIVKTSENISKIGLKYLLVVIFAIILLGIPRGLYILGKIYLRAHIANPDLKIIDSLGLIAILFSAWKIISITLSKIVDNVFNVDKTLLKVILKLLDKKEEENKGMYDKEKEIKILKPNSFGNIIFGILEYTKYLLESILK